MRHLLLLCLLSFTLITQVQATEKPQACNLTSFVAEYNLNTCNGELVGIDFNFTGTEFGLGGFNVIGPEGTQNYQLGDDYIYYVFSSCNEVIELTLQDINEPNCSLTIEVEAQCCECVMQNIVTETSLCNNGLFTLFAEIQATSGSCVTNGWTVTVCGNTYTMDDGPGYYFAEDIFCTDSLIEYQFCSIETGECFTKPGVNPCFGAGPCNLSSFTASYVSNGCSGEIKTIEFSYVGAGFGSNGYYVHNGSQEQFYEPGDPHLFETPANCNGPVQLTIVDAEDPACSLTTTLDPACCPCEVNNVEAATGSCNNGSFAVEVSMDIISGSCLFGDWTLTVDNVIYPLNFGGTNWIATGVSSNDSLVVLEICNPGAAWCEIVIVPNPCWQGGGSNCEITSFFAGYDTTLCNGELAGILFEFNAINFGTGGFTVSSGNITQSYMPGDDYVFFVPANCSNNVVLTLQDINDPSCSATVVLAEACCPCEADVVQVWTGPCVNGSFDVLANIEINSGSCYFGDWTLTINNDVYNLDYNTNSWVANGVTSSDSLIQAFICHPATAFCESVSFVNPCYNGNSGCTITSFTAEYSENHCDGELAGILFNVQGSQFGLTGFTVSADSFSQSYTLGDDFIFFVPALCSDSMVLTIRDNADSSCTASVLLGPACCPCMVDDIVVEPFACVNGSFAIEVLIGIESGSCFFGPWTATVNNVIYPLTYNGLSWYAGGFTSSDSIVYIEICHPASAFCEVVAITNPCWTAASNCFLTSFTASYNASGCNGELAAVGFAFTGTSFGNNGYILSSNNATQVYNLGDSTLFYLPALCGDSVVLTLSDVSNPSCSLSAYLGPACCPCVVDTIEAETGPCINGSFNLEVGIGIESGSCYFGNWTATAEGITYPLTPNNNGGWQAQLSLVGQFVPVIICNTPSNYCDTLIVNNPCFAGNNSCGFAISSMAFTSGSNGISASIKLDTTGSCNILFTTAVNGSQPDTTTLFEDYVFINGLSNLVAMFNIELCHLADPALCKDTLVSNPYYISETDDRENETKIFCHQNQVEIWSTENIGVEILDLNGKKLDKWKQLAGERHSWTSPYPSGIYLIHSTSSKGKNIYKCIIGH